MVYSRTDCRELRDISIQWDVLRGGESKILVYNRIDCREDW